MRRGTTGAAVAALLLATAAYAHLGTLSYSDVLVRGKAARFTLKFAAHLIPGARSDQRLQRADVIRAERAILAWLGDTVRLSVPDGACTASLLELTGPDQNDDLIVDLGFTCPGPATGVRIEFHPFDEALPDYRNIVSVQTETETSGFVFTRDAPVLVLGEMRSGAGADAAGGADAAQEHGGPRSSFREFFVLGVEHIWTGYDHLLFLLALMLPGGSVARIAAIVTAFTVAHSITLALAALDVLTLPAEPVEITIAASIVFAAASVLRERGVDRRWVITFAFGLIHGFGFAGVLRAIGLPPGGAAATALLAFNLGVEAGQLVVVALVVPLLHFALRGERGRTIRRAMAWAIIAFGVFWTVERTAAWLDL